MVASLCQKIPKTKNHFDICENCQELDNLENQAEKQKLTALRQAIKKKLVLELTPHSFTSPHTQEVKKHGAGDCPLLTKK